MKKPLTDACLRSGDILWYQSEFPGSWRLWLVIGNYYDCQLQDQVWLCFALSSFVPNKMFLVTSDYKADNAYRPHRWNGWELIRS